MDLGKTLGAAGAGAAIGSVVPGVGTAVGAGVGAAIGGIGGLLFTDGSMDAAERERYAHKIPSDASTEYLPTKGDANYDRVYGPNDAYSVYGLDKTIGELNRSMLNYAPAHIREYCEAGATCDKGCSGSTYPAPGHVDHSIVTGLMEKFEAHLEHVKSVMEVNADEMWVRKVLDHTYGRGGVSDVAKYLDQTQEVKASVKELVEAANHTGDTSYRAFREAIRAIRTNLAYGTTDGTSPWYSWEEKFNETDRHHAMDNINAAQSNVNHALHENQDKIDKLNNAVEEWKFVSVADASPDKPRGPGAFDNPMGGDTRPPKGTEPPRVTPPIDGNTGTTVGKVTPEGVGGGGAPTPPIAPIVDGPNKDDTEGEDTKSLADKLDELMNRQNPNMGMPPGMGMPGGGMPGGMGMPDFGQGMGQSPFGQDLPMSAESSDDYLHPETDDDGGDDESADGGGNLNNLGADEPTPDDDTPPDDGGVAPVDAGVPSAQPAAFDPNSEAARTVDMGEGRMVTFPSAHMADTMRAMVSSDPGNPKSLYMAASESGYTLPPQGEDIGRPVEPSTMKVGDVISAEGTHGVYLGDGDVRMEDGSTQKLADVASRMDGEHQGIFRLTEPDSSGGSTPVQTVSDVHSTPQEVPVSTPGIPTDDAPVVGSTSESTANAPGLSMSATALDPNSAFGQ